VLAKRGGRSLVRLLLKRETSRELAICGYNAVVAALEVHPERVKRLFFVPRIGRALGPYCKRLAEEKKIYRQVDEPELERVAGTVHHGGVALIVEAPDVRAPRRAEIEQWARDREPLLLLDGIGNAHNLGALARTAAFFGLRRIICGGSPDQALLSSAAYRVAEGGLEQVECYKVPNLAVFCRDLGSLYRVVGTALREAQPLPPATIVRGWPEPVALVLGNEETGISRFVREACRHLFYLPGSGKMESLNVSAAGAVLMYHFFHDAPGRG
jgi:RNA methyltransferase, TrmH family